MSSTIAIRAQGLCKEYRLGTINHGMLFRDLQSWWARLRGRDDPNAKIFDRPVDSRDEQRLHGDRFLALQDVSFEVRQGEVLGVIGRNGAGKSTLLKILSRITLPTEGAVGIRGRITSLLEVGTGFHAELTGRENVFLNGAILGMRKREVEKKLAEIVDFAEISQFLDTPVKRYSSGMYVRLAFAVAAHLDSEILVIDEVLAVGDLNFQRKCLGKMDSVRKAGRTVLFVSHGMASIRSLCERSILLSNGRLIADGPSADVIDTYLESTTAATFDTGEIKWSTLVEAPGCAEFRLMGIRLLNAAGGVKNSFHAGQPITVELRYCVPAPIKGIRVVLEFTNSEGVVAFSSTDHAMRGEQTEAGEYVSRCTIPKDLLNAGRYYLALHVGQPGVKVLLMLQPFLSFNVEFASQHGSMVIENWRGVVAPRLDWETVQVKEAGWV